MATRDDRARRDGEGDGEVDALDDRFVDAVLRRMSAEGRARDARRVERALEALGGAESRRARTWQRRRIGLVAASFLVLIGAALLWREDRATRREAEVSPAELCERMRRRALRHDVDLEYAIEFEFARSELPPPGPPGAPQPPRPEGGTLRYGGGGLFTFECVEKGGPGAIVGFDGERLWMVPGYEEMPVLVSDFGARPVGDDPLAFIARLLDGALCDPSRLVEVLRRDYLLELRRPSKAEVATLRATPRPGRGLMGLVLEVEIASGAIRSLRSSGERVSGDGLRFRMSHSGSAVHTPSWYRHQTHHGPERKIRVAGPR